MHGLEIHFNCSFIFKSMLGLKLLRFHIQKGKVSPPVVRSHATVDHAYVFGNGFHFVDALFVIQNGFLLLLRSEDHSISSCNKITSVIKSKVAEYPHENTTQKSQV